MEIERKFTIKHLPDNLDPVIRIRREDDEFYMTYKGQGMMTREEHNLPLNRESYYHLLAKADGNIITKKRYLIPLLHPQFAAGGPKPPEDYSLTIELDVFEPPFAPLILAEVEFGSKNAAETFLPPDWFKEDVTYNASYHNSYLSMRKL